MREERWPSAIGAEWARRAKHDATSAVVTPCDLRVWVALRIALAAPIGVMGKDHVGRTLAGMPRGPGRRRKSVQSVFLIGKAHCVAPKHVINNPFALPLKPISYRLLRLVNVS